MSARAQRPNQGIVITGGQVTVGQAVAGAGAQAHYTGGGAQDTNAQLKALRQRLDELAQALAQQPGRVPTQPMEALDAARSEAARSRPDPGRLKRLMEGVAEGAKSVTSVAGAIQAVTALIASL